MKAGSLIFSRTAASSSDLLSHTALASSSHVQPTAPRVRQPRLTLRITTAALIALGLAACGEGTSHPESAPVTKDALPGATAPTDATALASAQDSSTYAAPATDAGAQDAVQAGVRQTKAIATQSPSATPCGPLMGAAGPLPLASQNNLASPVSKPSYLVPSLDRTSRSCLVRVTDNQTQIWRGPTQRNDYARRQAFNADSSRFFLQDGSGFWYVYSARTGQLEQKLDGLSGATPRLAGDAEPFWHPTDPNQLYFIPTNGVGMQIYVVDLRSRRVRTVADMGPAIRRIWSDAAMAYTKAEGSPSADGRYWCFMARAYNNSSSQPMRGVFTWDLDQHRIMGHMNMSEAPDHVSMTPTGRYCVVSHDSAQGTRAYNRTFRAPYNSRVSGQYIQVHHKSEHSDIAFNHLMQDTYVSLDYQSDKGDIFMVNLEDGRRTPLLSTYQNRTATAYHISGKAYGKPGWVLVSTYAEHYGPNPGQPLTSDLRQWMHRRMFAVSLNANPEIRTIADINANVFQYEDEPHATVNHDFTRILFNSTWNGSSSNDREVFMATLPTGALRSR